MLSLICEVVVLSNFVKTLKEQYFTIYSLNGRISQMCCLQSFNCFENKNKNMLNESNIFIIMQFEIFNI